MRKAPDIILVLNKECTGDECIDLWKEHDILTAVRKDRVDSLDADLMARPSPRIMDGVEELARGGPKQNGKRRQSLANRLSRTFRPPEILCTRGSICTSFCVI